MTPERITRRYFVIAGLYTLSASLIWGVNTLFLLEAGLDILQVFIANAVFTAGMAVFEIPTGVVADTLGRRVSFLLSVVVLVLCTLGYVVVAASGGSLFLFALVSIFMGLGFTFYSGAVEAWLVDALWATGYQGELNSIFARGSFVSGAAMLIGTVTGGFLGNISLFLPFVVRAALLAMVFIIAFLGMHDIGYETRVLKTSAMPSEMRRVAKDNVKYGWGQQQIRLLMAVNFIQSAFFLWAFYAWQPYLLDLLDRPDSVWVAGVIAALVSLAMMVGNGLAEWFARFCGRRTTLLVWSAAIQSIAAIGVGLSNSFWVALVMLLIMMGAAGVAQPVSQAFIHQMIPSGQRATIISFSSMFGSVGSVIGQAGLGRLAQARSLASGYMVGGLFTLLALPVLYALRRESVPADAIVGAAGTQSACAAQGLPEVSAVDASAATI